MSTNEVLLKQQTRDLTSDVLFHLVLIHFV
jgi:hypothetical protein